MQLKENEMGCDIHMVLEKKFNDKWVGLHAYPSVSTDAVEIYLKNEGAISKTKSTIDWLPFKVGRRNYGLFAALAGVRGDSPFGHELLGLPDDASDLAACLSEEYGDDGHSHSHMLLPEFLRCYAYATDDDAYSKGCVAAVEGTTTPFIEFADEVLGFKFYPDEGNVEKYRIVFWFDN
jgi:hypothetical protein